MHERPGGEPPPQSPGKDVEIFVKRITESGLLSAEKLERFLPPRGHSADVHELARQLVRSRELTIYQVQQVGRGRAKSLILGNYTILDEIGAGGMGQVYKAKHRRMERVVAVKTLPAATLKDPGAIARFQREVVAAAKLRHPNIVAADDADESGGVHFLVMEYVDGRDLATVVRENGPIPVVAALGYVIQAARGLEFAHKRGVIHRDIKPGNLLLSHDGVVKVLDMGLARVSEEGDVATQAQLTETGAIMGTVDYMPPEQALSTKDADARADIYSLGCSFHYLVTGRPPYQGDTLMARLLAHRDARLPRLDDDVPAAVRAAFEKMIAKRPEDRFQTMAEVIAALEPYPNGLQVTLDDRPKNDLERTLALPADPTLDDSLSALLRGIVDGSAKTQESRAVALSTSPPRRDRGLVMAAGAALLGLAFITGLIVTLRPKDGTRDAPLTPLAATPPAPPAPAAERPREPAKSPNWVKEVGSLPPASQVEAVKKKLKDLNPEYHGEGTWTIGENGSIAVLGLPADHITDFAPLRAVKLSALAIDPAHPGKPNLTPLAGLSPSLLEYPNAGVNDLAPLREMPVHTLDFRDNRITDLSPLQGRPLTNLHLDGCPRLFDLGPLRGMRLEALYVSSTKVSDLAPLKGMPLGTLICDNTRVSDLSPLAGMPLSHLECQLTQVSDLSPLAGRPLRHLECQFTRVSDLSPLAGVSLETLLFTPANITRGIEVIRKMDSLTAIGVQRNNLLPPKVFWEHYDHGDYGRPRASVAPPALPIDAAFRTWMEGIVSLPAEQQIDAVKKKLIEFNPGYGGEGNWRITNGEVTGLVVTSSRLFNLAPLLALQNFGTLVLSAEGGRPDLAKVAPLKLKYLDCHHANLTDLAPLRGRPLINLSVHNNRITDLAPLRGMPLESLSCQNNPLSDLMPLRGIGLERLNIEDTDVSDLTPLAGMPLKSLIFTPAKIKQGIEIIRRMNHLGEIGVHPDRMYRPKMFWEQYDRGEFGTP